MTSHRSTPVCKSNIKIEIVAFVVERGVKCGSYVQYQAVFENDQISLKKILNFAAKSKRHLDDLPDRF